MRVLLLVPVVLLTSCVPRSPEANMKRMKDEEGQLHDEIRHLEVQLRPLRGASDQAVAAALPPDVSGMAIPGGHAGPFRISWHGVHAGVKLSGSVAAQQDSASSPATVRVVKGR